MVILINGKVATFPNYELKAIFSDYLLAQETYRFHGKVKQTFTTNKHLIYLNQLEKVTLYQTDPAVCYIGTDDTTTCHFVVLDCPNAGIISAAHLDGTKGTTAAFFESYISKITNAMKKYVYTEKLKDQHVKTNKHGESETDTEFQGLDALNHFEVSVSMVGGFLDDNFSSKRLSVEILKMMHECQEIRFRLQLCAITDLNNTIKQGGFNFPIHYGAVYNIRIHEMFPATFTLDSREPYSILRSTRFCGPPLLHEVYDPDKNLLILKDFEYKGIINNSYYLHVSESPNDVLRRYSTSPRQEKENFASHIRSVFKLMYDNPDPSIFYDPKTNFIQFKCNPKNGEWMKL